METHCITVAVFESIPQESDRPHTRISGIF
jgi:hypothetical protein